MSGILYKIESEVKCGVRGLPYFQQLWIDHCCFSSVRTCGGKQIPRKLKFAREDNKKGNGIDTTKSMPVSLPKGRALTRIFD